MRRTLVIFGSNTAKEVLEAASLACKDQYEEISLKFFDLATFDSQLAEETENRFDQVDFHVGIADCELKEAIVSACERRSWQPRSIVHPSAIVSPSGTIGEGSFVGPLAIISSNARVGAHTIVHLHSSIGHDAIVGDYCAVLPGARVSGNVTIGNRTLIGSNAFLFQGISVAADCRIDALTYVGADLAANHIASVRIQRHFRGQETEKEIVSATPVQIVSNLVEAMREAIGPASEDSCLSKPQFPDSAWSYVKDCLDSTWVSSAGQYVNAFEQALCTFTGAEHAVAVVNGTAALQVCFHLAGVCADEEVIMPALTFVATANAAKHQGAIPHFVDVNPDYLGMCPDSTGKNDWLRWRFPRMAISGTRLREDASLLSAQCIAWDFLAI